MKMKDMKGALALAVALGLTGCGDSDEVAMVKQGHLAMCPAHTVEQMVDGFFGSPDWESGTAENGQDFVNVSGDITLHDKPVRAVVQFSVDKKAGTFGFNALETNDVPQPDFLALALLAKMCESVAS